VWLLWMTIYFYLKFGWVVLLHNKTTCREHSNPVCDISTCWHQNLLMEIYFYCPTLEDLHTILSNVAVTPLIFTILIFRWVHHNLSALSEQCHRFSFVSVSLLMGIPSLSFSSHYFEEWSRVEGWGCSGPSTHQSSHLDLSLFL
jgi:hypothetical protein